MNKLGFYPAAPDTDRLQALREGWERQYRYGSVAERKAREARWSPYYSLIYQAQLGQPYTIPAEPGPVVRTLAEQGLVHPEAAVLDIGCGTGGTALELAQLCRSVTAVDSNETAIEVLRERCAGTHTENLTALCASWNDGRPGDAWDLVISAMCPAICNPEELLAMEACARETCVLVTVMKGSADKYRSQMMRELNLRPEGMITEYSTYLDVLRAMGRDVTVWTMERFTKRNTSLEELLWQFPTYFEIFGMEQEASVSYLKSFFEKHQENGFLADETQMNVAMLVWKPVCTEGGTRQ